MGNPADDKRSIRLISNLYMSRPFGCSAERSMVSFYMPIVLTIAIDVRSQLLRVTNTDDMFDTGEEGGQDMSFEDLTGFFNDQHFGAESLPSATSVV